MFDSADARSSVAQVLDDKQRAAYLEKRKQELLKTVNVRGAANVNGAGAVAENGEEGSNTETIKFVAMAFGIVALVGLGSVYGVIYIVDHI